MELNAQLSLPSGDVSFTTSLEQTHRNRFLNRFYRFYVEPRGLQTSLAGGYEET